MLKNRRMIAVLCLAGSLAAANVYGQTGSGNTGSTSTSSTSATQQGAQDVVQTASANPDFSTLVSAVQAADLGTTLSGKGPFTVFAPTNEAFEALPAGTLDNLLKAENKATLANVLKFHVVPGRLTASELKDGQQLKTVAGETLTVSKAGGKVTVNGAEVTQPDLAASNGVIHVISTVLVPSGSMGNTGTKK